MNTQESNMTKKNLRHIIGEAVFEKSFSTLSRNKSEKIKSKIRR